MTLHDPNLLACFPIRVVVGDCTEATSPSPEKRIPEAAQDRDANPEFG